jgi:hypothetical protein
LFYYGCMPLRLGFAYAAYVANESHLRWMGLIALLIGVLFILVWVTKSRNVKGAFGGNVWWSNLRPIHGILYIIFAISALNGSRDGYKILLADAGLGFVSFKYQYSYP